MIKEGVQIISPVMDDLVNSQESSKKERALINYLERTPLSNLPNNILVNITVKLGPIKSMEILEASNRVHDGIRNRDMNDNEKIWQKPYITILRNQSIEYDKRLAERLAEFSEIVIQRRNWYDKSDIDDESEKFDIVAVVGYEKRGRRDFYKVLWLPRILCAHKTYPDIFPELLGKAWPLHDESNWIGSGSDYWATVKEERFKESRDTFKWLSTNNDDNNWLL